MSYPYQSLAIMQACCRKQTKTKLACRVLKTQLTPEHEGNALGFRLHCPAMGWMHSNIALRGGRYVTGSQCGTLADVRAAGDAVARIASVAGAGVGVEAGRHVVGAGGVSLHTTGTP